MRVRTVAVVLLVAAVAAFAKVIEVELDDGTRIHGSVVTKECTEDNLVLLDLRTGAKRQIPWNRIAPEKAQALKIDLGFEVEEGGEAFVTDAVEIRNRAGVVFIGKLLNESSVKSDGEFRLKTSEGERRIRMEDVSEGPDPVQVDSLQVYTAEELYRKLVKNKPPANAEDHFRTAEVCRRIGALDHAREHYQAVLDAADSRYNADTIRRLLERVEKRIGQREAESALRDVKQAIVYNRFEQAAQLAEAFRQKYTDEDLLNDLKDLEQEAVERRKQHFIALVKKTLLAEVKSLLDKKVREKDLTLSTAQRYASGDASSGDSVTATALKIVGEKLKIEPKEALEFWNQRSLKPVQKAFYRDGTFVVIPNLKDPLAKVQPPKAPPGKPGQKGPGAAVPKPHPMKSPEDWFKDRVGMKRFTDLRDFLFAWWADKSRMVEVLEPKDETCGNCAGKGYTQEAIPTPQGMVAYFDRCQSCYAVGYTRVVQFR